MSGLIRKLMPSPKIPTPPETPDYEGAQRLAAFHRMRRRKGRGVTELTGGLADDETPAVKKLLGR
ncbi:MAG: hypothetical protein LPH21_06360 [Shewanella sp.]|nr:hypothetical protein [Shewanella sp.]